MNIKLTKAQIQLLIDDAFINEQAELTDLLQHLLESNPYEQWFVVIPKGIWDDMVAL